MTGYKVDGYKTVANPQTTKTTSTQAQTGAKESASPFGQAQLAGTDFLNLLVHQLENQDPLNPMDNQEFAVQLAQFSSLEQLIGIGKKLDSGLGAGGSISSLASYLGHEVVLKDQALTIANGKGPNLMVDMPKGVQSGRIDLLDENGVVVGQQELTNLNAGRQVISLNGLTVPDGVYQSRVMVVDQAGKFKELDGKVTGTVEGFVAEPEPKLIVNGEQVDVAQVVEVYAGKNA